MSYFIRRIHDSIVDIQDHNNQISFQCEIQNILSPQGQPVNTQLLEIGDPLSKNNQSYLCMHQYSPNRLYETATYLGSTPNSDWVISNFPYIRPFGPFEPSESCEKNFKYALGAKILEFSFIHRSQDILTTIKNISPETKQIIDYFYSKVEKNSLYEALASCFCYPNHVISIVECPIDRYRDNFERLLGVLNIKLRIITLPNIEMMYLNHAGQIEFVLLFVENKYNILYTTQEKQQIEKPSSVSSTENTNNIKISEPPKVSLFQSAQDMIKLLPITSWNQIQTQGLIDNVAEKKTQVLKGVITLQGQPVDVAVKSKLTPAYNKKFEDEAEYMVAVQDNSNFLKLYGAFWDKFEGQYRYNIVMELSIESLDTRIKRWEDQKNISHRDIKPQNVLIVRNGDYKIIDFDISKTITRNPNGVTEQDIRIEISGTRDYFSPELFAYSKGEPCEGILFNKSDVYSLGMTILRMVTKDDFSVWNNNFSSLQNLIHGIIDGAVTKLELNKLLKLMLTVDPSRRPKFKELEKHLLSDGTLTPQFS